MRNPCKRDCPLRTGTCHATCKEYFDYAAWCEERRKHNRKNGIVYNYIKDSVEASRKVTR